MERQQPAADLDWLLHSNSEEDDLAVPDRFSRTIDEILLSHSSPSPPSSPSSLTQNYSHRRQKDADASTTMAAESDSYNLISPVAESSGSSGTKYARRVLPQLFGSGVIRSNSKPGAALEAAAAASRSIPTPHAVAIKLRKANTSVVWNKVGTTAIDGMPFSQSLLASNNSRCESDAGTDLMGLDYSDVMNEKSEEEEGSVKLQQFSCEQLDSSSDRVYPTPGMESHEQIINQADEVLTELKTQMEADNLGDILGIVDQENLTSSASGFPHPSATSENDTISDGLNGASKIFPSDEFGEEWGTVGPVPVFEVSNTPDNNELTAGGASTCELRNVVSEHGSEDYTSSLSDVGDLLSLQENDTDARTKENNSHSFSKPLLLAEEIEKTKAFTGLHFKEGAAAQPMRLQGMPRLSMGIGYFDVSAGNAVTRTISSPAFRNDHGSPQVVTVHLNSIAVGMSKGTILVVPSKYTAHQVDNMNAKISMLGLQGDRSHVSVTSICFNQQGDLLFAGYDDGHYTLWDVQKASALKVITEHRAPIVHLLYLGQDYQVTRQFHVVSGDSMGVVKLIKFSVRPWLNMISYTKSVKLFDETTSKVLCASPLLYDEWHGGAMLSQGNSAISSGGSSNMGGVEDEGVVIFITSQSALVAKVCPTVEVYAQIPRPEGVKEGVMPYAALNCMSQTPGPSSENAQVETSDKILLVAIAWDQKIQVAKVVKSEIKSLEKWNLENPAIGMAWLDSQMLVILTLTAQLYLCSDDGTVIHHSSFSLDGCVWDALISYHIYFSNVSGSPERAYHNSVAVRGASVYILGPEHLVVSRLLSWKERIEILRKAGDWMGALNMAMMIYDGQSHGVVDLPKNLEYMRSSVMSFLVELIQLYVTEVFSYMSVAFICHNETVDRVNDIKEEYTRVGGVAVEYCVHIGRTDILFDEILSKFEDANNKETFLELLEPYILKDMLGSLPPEVMQALVEHYSKRGWLQRVEQCVLHMDILSLDFNQVIRLCREHGLHGALIYLFNKGLDDFKTPLEELLTILRNSQIENASTLGYRMLVYLKYCFQGLAFPPGHGNISPTRLPSLRKELLQFLMEGSSTLDATDLPKYGDVNLIYLLKLDTEATLDVLNCSFTEDNLPSSTDSSPESFNLSMDSAQSIVFVQKIVDILAAIIDASHDLPHSPLCGDDRSSLGLWPTEKDVGHIYEYIIYSVVTERANVSRDILSKILEYLTSEVDFPYDVPIKTTGILKRREKQLLSLLEVVPETQLDVPHLLHLSEKVPFHQVCGYIQSSRHQYVSALRNYMKIENEPVHAFSFINEMLERLSAEECGTFESAIISHIPELVKLSREGTYFLITSHFSGKIHHILSELRSQPESFFLYLKTAIEVHTTGKLNLSCLQKFYDLNFPVGRKSQQHSSGVEAYLNTISSSLNLLRDHEVHVTDELIELYFELLCQYEPKSVLKFLETSENYRVDHCLRLCQEYGVVDAASYLFERVGEVGSALSLILSNLKDKFVILESEIQKGSSDTSLDNLSKILKKKVVAEIFDIVSSCIGLCQRNNIRLEPDESEHLWFQLLDLFFDPLRDSSIDGVNYERKVMETTLDGSLGLPEDEEYNIKWKSSKSRKRAQMMKKLSSIFLKEIVKGMIGYVRLPRIMLKLLSDNGDQEFGDFKLTILGMLGTYDFERKILDTAKTLIEDDTYYTMSLLRKGASHGYAPRSLVCCICNSLLVKTASDSSIQIFSCGHSLHSLCEPEKNEASHRGGSTAGCPICNCRKKAAPVSVEKSMFEDNGLVSKSSSRSHQAGGIPAPHPHDHDGLDNNYFSHPASTFELLNHLQNDKKYPQLDTTIQLRVAPPSVYHEKVKKQIDSFSRQSASHASTTEKSSGKKGRDVKLKGSSLQKTSVFRGGIFRIPSA